ncbi:MAG: type II toxin-antitoxin system RelE/ParE family toxin [Corallococcus sp.]|nr:type II toxin-antitoxin system RelE/ParE family toxin [Corallococcus sp.]
MEIRLTPEAHSDILGIYRYVQKDGEQIARNQVEYIYDGIEKLAQFPNMGAALQKFVERTTALRYLIVHNVYIVIYDVTDAIDVIRVFRKDQNFISILGINNSI